MKGERKIVFFIIINVVAIVGMMMIAWNYRNYMHKKDHDLTSPPVSLEKYLLEEKSTGGLPTLKDIAVGLVFGTVFGFLDNVGLWMGIDTFFNYIPGGTLTKGAWGNTYSDFIGATIGTFIASIASEATGYSDDNEPIWVNTIGIFIGCILGMEFGRAVTSRD
jgi:hypothetical protein